MDSLTRSGLARNTFNITNFSRPATSSPAPRQASNTGQAVNSGEAAQAPLPSDTTRFPSVELFLLSKFGPITSNTFFRQALVSLEATTLSGLTDPHLPTPPIPLTRSGCQLQGSDIPAGFIYQDSDLTGVNISGCILIRCKIAPSDSDGRKSNVRNCTLIDCDVLSAHLENCSISSAAEVSELISCNIVAGRISHAVSANCNFEGVKVEGLNCSGFSYFENCKIKTCEFRFGPRFGKGCEILNSYVLYRDEHDVVQKEWVVRRWIE